MAETKAKRKRGRPKTGQNPKHYFRMADDEYAVVEEAAKQVEQGNTSAYIRRVILARAKKDLQK